MLLDKDKVVKVGLNEVLLDPEKLTFNEATLNKFLQESAGWCNYYGQQLADAESFLQWHEASYEKAYAEKFSSFKEDGGSDKLSEARSKAHPEIEKAKKKVIAAKRSVKKLQLFIRAMDKAHDNAMSFGHMLRREMDKIRPVIRNIDPEMEKSVDDIVKAGVAPS